MTNVSNITRVLRDLDDKYRVEYRQIMEAEDLVPAAKKKRLEEASTRYQTEWRLKKREVEQRLQEHGEALYRRAYPPESDPSDPQRAMVLELKRNRVRDRVQLLRGQDGKLVGEYEEALKRGDTDAAKEYEQVLPHIITEKSARERLAERVRQEEWARMGEPQRRAVKELEGFYKDHQSALQGLELQAGNRRRGYAPVEQTETQLLVNGDEVKERARRQEGHKPANDPNEVPSWIQGDGRVADSVDVH